MWLRFGNRYIKADDVLQFEIIEPTGGGAVVAVTVPATVIHYKLNSEQTASFFTEQIIKAVSLKEDEVYTYCGIKAKYAAEPNFAYVDEIYEAVRAECGEVADA